jgi:RHS repeat-associated protein
MSARAEFISKAIYRDRLTISQRNPSVIAGSGIDGPASRQRRDELAQPQQRPWVLLFVLLGMATGAMAQMVLPAPGYINTVAGKGTQGYSGDGAAAVNAQIYYPQGMAVDAQGNLYIADEDNNRIRKVTAATGIITTVAGNGTGGFSGDGGSALSAELYLPSGVAVDSSGNIYIADTYNNRIRKVTASTGIITTVAGNRTGSYPGDSGPALAAWLASPLGIAFDASGNLYVADSADCLVRKIVISTGIITSVAGNGVACAYAGDGYAATVAELNYPSAVALDPSGNFYIADRNNFRVRKVTLSTGKISTVAGTGVNGSSGDGGLATVAKIGPTGVAVDGSGNLYIADASGSSVRKVLASNGIINTVAGNGTVGYSGDGGLATSASLNIPTAVALDAGGNNLFLSDRNQRIRAVGVGKNLPIITWATPAAILYGTALSNVQLSATASVPGTFAYTPALNTVLTAGQHTLSATFTPTDTTNYRSVTATVVLTVNSAPAAFTWNPPADITYGTRLSSTQLNVTPITPGTVVFTPAAGTVLPVGLQILWATFTPTDSSDYVPFTGSVGIDVLPAENKWDSGTVTLVVNGSTISTATYGAGATPTSVAESLARNTNSGAPVTVTAMNNALDIVAKATGSSTDYSYSLQNTAYDSADFASPSFPYQTLSGTLDGGADSGARPGTVYSYQGVQYDAVGNLTSYSDLVMGTWAAQYDTLNRLKTDVASAGPYSGQNYCWAYDPFGNRTAQIEQGAACPTPETSVPPTAAYNTKNQVTWVQNSAPSGFAYDTAGNVTADNLNSYLYDAEGRICAVASSPVPGITTMTGYLYYADGVRAAKGTIAAWSCDPSVNGFQVTNDFVVGPGNEQLAEYARNTSGAMAIDHNNVWAAGSLLATNDGSGPLHFYLDDPLGTRRVQTDQAGVVEQTCKSLPFGDGLNCTSAGVYTSSLTAPTEHHFTGKERDSESGNDYFGARYYASTMGRFLSPDWSAKAEPVPYAKLDDPQTLNLYAYVRNNPLVRVDPDGHLGCGFLWLGNCPPPPLPPPPATPKAPGLPKDVPSAHVPGPEYKTADAAGKAAIRATNRKSIRENKEIAGRVVKNDNMTYGVTKGPESGRTISSSDPGSVPPGTVNAEIWHDHGAATPGYDNENFSSADYGRSRAEGVPILVGTPGGQIRKYDPQTNVDTQVGTTPH